MAEISSAADLGWGEMWRWILHSMRAYCVSLDKSTQCVEVKEDGEVLQEIRRKRVVREERKKLLWSTRWSNIMLTLHTLMIKYDRQFDCILCCVIDSYKHMLQLFSPLKMNVEIIKVCSSPQLSLFFSLFDSLNFKFFRESEACSRNCSKITQSIETSETYTRISLMMGDTFSFFSWENSELFSSFSYSTSPFLARREVFNESHKIAMKGEKRDFQVTF